MRIMMLSWEYPPRIIGGISRVVHDLAHAMVKQGNEVHVITCWQDGAKEFEDDNGVLVYRVHPYNIDTDDFLKWVMHLNFSMLEKAGQLCSNLKFDVVHAHDWIVAYSAKTIKHAYNIPLVSTIHATEHGRNHGIHNQVQSYINSMEWLLTYESCKVICNSNYMKNEVRNVFQLPEDKINIVHNGIFTDAFDGVYRDNDFRRKIAMDNEKVVFFVGRLVREKGVHVLLGAIPKIIERYHDVKFVIAGKGPGYDSLKSQAYEMGIAHKTLFTGYVSDDDLKKMYKCADIAVFPSLYEPFGIVALEGMVAGAPVVVTDTCGLGEIVEHGVDGMKAYTDNSNSLADCILELLFNNKLAETIRSKALKKVDEMYNWYKISEQTIQVYKDALRMIGGEQSEVEEKSVAKKEKSIFERKGIKKSRDGKVEKMGVNPIKKGLAKGEASIEEMIIRSRKTKSSFAELH